MMLLTSIKINEGSLSEMYLSWKHFFKIIKQLIGAHLLKIIFFMRKMRDSFLIFFYILYNLFVRASQRLMMQFQIGF